jgi:hypothetical protein
MIQYAQMKNFAIQNRTKNNPKNPAFAAVGFGFWKIEKA